MSNDAVPMTPACRERLRNELRRIKEVDRAQNMRDLEEARAHGDLSENAEYHAAKERRATLDARLRYLESRLARAQVIDPATITSDRIGFGATVSLRDLDTDESLVYSLVGEDESDATVGRISIASPIARAMVGKHEGDSVVVRLPKGDRELEVVKIDYRALD
jgi:transcription elongation factor GreA